MKEEGNAMIQKKPEVKGFGIAQLTVKFASDMGVRNDEGQLSFLRSAVSASPEVFTFARSSATGTPL
jgi:hypothetical protein